eukprot:scaffold4613_cov129-Isochrysis_galbana.AAC.29
MFSTSPCASMRLNGHFAGEVRGQWEACRHEEPYRDRAHVVRDGHSPARQYDVARLLGVDHFLEEDVIVARPLNDNDLLLNDDGVQDARPLLLLAALDPVGLVPLLVPQDAVPLAILRLLRLAAAMHGRDLRGRRG